MIPHSFNNLSHDEIQRLVGATAGLIYEIGANDGTDTLEMLKRFPQAHIHCFECDPRANKKFSEMVGNNCAMCDSRLFSYDVAIGAQGGVSQFYQSDGDEPAVAGWDKSGSLQRPTGHLKRSPEITFPRAITVRTRSLDGWSEDAHAICRIFRPGKSLPIVDFIRLDVQGGERGVFAGGAKTLARTRWMLAECHRTELYEGQFSEPEMIDYLAKTGWECLGRYADDLLLRNGSLQ